MYKTPIFVSGIGRSGTSAVIKSLSEHKDIVKPDRIGEGPFVSHFIKFLVEFENRSSERDYNIRNYQLDEEQRATEFSRLLSMLQYGKDIFVSEQNEKHWIAKVSLSSESFQKALEIFKDIKIVYVMRNGIEVVNSAKSFKGFSHLTFDELCSRWVDNIKQCRYVHTSPNCAVVRHHELVHDPEEVYRGVFDTLRMSQDTAPAEFISTNLFNSSFDKSEQLASTASVFQERLNCWSDWTEIEQEKFIEVCDEMMQEFEFPRPYDAKSSTTFEIKQTVDSDSLFTKRSGSKEPDISWLPEDWKTELSDFNKKVKNIMPATQFDYYANPSVKHDFFFMENPKVASTSLLKELHRYEHASDVKLTGDPHDREKSPIPKLTTLSEQQQWKVLCSDEFPRYSFVRNPYTRLLSAYLSKIKKPLRAKREILAIVNGVDKREVDDLTQEVSFAEFVEVVCSQETKAMNAHWRLQSDQILIDHIEYSFIGRFERLNDDYRTICNAVYGIEPSKLGQSSNKTSSSDFITQYYNASLATRVYEKFNKDFDLFGYSQNIERLVGTSEPFGDMGAVMTS